MNAYLGQSGRAQPWTPSILRSARLTLEPLRVGHAAEMTVVLADPGLYAFTGGAAPSTAELTERYQKQIHGRSSDGSEIWLNWIVRRLKDTAPVGYIQVTITDLGAPCAELAWVTGAEYQGRGYAREAAGVVVGWLRSQRVIELVAHIRSGHDASARVARAIGLVPTETVVDGEIRWRG